MTFHDRKARVPWGSRQQFDLFIPAALTQNPWMERENDRPAGFQGLVQWAMTPPQAYAVYAICVILIGGISFLAGTLNPKKPPPPPTIAAPRRS
jgi:hypothetical protein